MQILKSEVERLPRDRLLRIVAFTLAITVMTATMFNIALPEIMAEFELSLAQVSWVTSVYLLIYAVSTVIYGKLADTCKLKNLLTFGLIVFAFGSLIGLVAQDLWMLLLGRIVQAAGAAVIPATAAIIPVRNFPVEIRGKALGIAMTGGAIGSALGPAVAALLISVLHWRFLFCMPLLTLLALPYYRKYLNDEPRDKGQIDWIGGGLLGGTVTLLLLAVTNGAWMPVVGCIFLFGLFVMRIRSTTEPFIRPSLFRNRDYCIGLVIAFLSTGIGYSLFFLTPQLLFEVNHLAAGMVGFVMIPAAAATALLGRKSGIIADLKGNSFLFYSASIFLLSCFLLLSSFAGVSSAWIAFFLIFGNVGQAFSYIALSNAISRMLPPEQSGVGMGLLSMLNFIAGAVFASLYGKMVDHGANLNWNPLQAHANAAVYSNIYLILSALIVVISLFYYFGFDKAKRSDYLK